MTPFSQKDDNKRIGGGGRRRGDSLSFRIIWWILGMMSMISIWFAGGWGRQMTGKVNQIDNTVQSNSNRISKMEQIVIEREKRLIRIENKQDRILELLK